MANDVLLNTTIDLNGKTLVTAEGDRSISGLLTFNRGASAPFAVGAGGASVTNLDADKVDGQHAPTGTIVGTTDVQTLTNKILGSGTPTLNRVAAITLTGTQNDMNLALVGNSYIPFTNATDLIIDGIASGFDGQIIVLSSQGVGNVYLAHQNAGSTAANRIINFAISGNTPLAAGVGMAVLVYDGLASRWRLVKHEQGASIAPTFSAGNYAGQGFTWTVASGGVSTQRFYLNGRNLTVTISLNSTTIGAAPSNVLTIGNAAWGGFLITGGVNTVTTGWTNDTGAFQACLFQVNTATSNALILAEKAVLASWTTQTGSMSLLGQITFEVQ